MESHTLQVLADQAKVALEEAERQERENEVQGKILHAVTKGRRESYRVLVLELGVAQQVRNIRIRNEGTGWVSIIRTTVSLESPCVCMSGISVKNS